jgi:hypothetical protein
LSKFITGSPISRWSTYLLRFRLAIASAKAATFFETPAAQVAKSRTAPSRKRDLRQVGSQFDSLTNQFTKHADSVRGSG